MSTSDPSQVDSATLTDSLIRDLMLAKDAVLRGDYLATGRWLDEARITANELACRVYMLSRAKYDE